MFHSRGATGIRERLVSLKSLFHSTTHLNVSAERGQYLAVYVWHQLEFRL